MRRSGGKVEVTKVDMTEVAGRDIVDVLRRGLRWLPPAGSPIVVAVSGGADSVALWAGLASLRLWPLHLWHLDHGLRADSPADARFVQELVLRLGGSVHLDQLNTRALAESGEGLEAAGRRLRYAGLRACAQQVGASVVVTAHHRDDQAETVLLNALRGAGPIGLMGIARRRRLGKGVVLVRPLLSCRRSELRQWLTDQAIPWREDPSNADVHFRRNHLRHQVLPKIIQLFPDAVLRLAAVAQRQRVRSRDHRRQARTLWQNSFSAAGVLGLPAILAAPESVRFFVWRRLVRHCQAPLQRRALQDLDALARGGYGRRFHIGPIIFTRQRSGLAWQAAEPADVGADIRMIGSGPWQHGAGTVTLRLDVAPATWTPAPCDAWLATAAIQGGLQLRTPRPGERWQPLGCAGERSVVRSLAEHGVPSRQRRVATVLADDHGILWIPDVGIAERARVPPTITDNDQQVWHALWTPLASAPTVRTMIPAHLTVSAVILAAGKGTRMGSDLAKVLHPLVGKPLVSHVLGTCAALGLGQRIVVVGHQRETVAELAQREGALSAVQDQQLGTGHAVRCAEAIATGTTILVLCGDCPLTPASLLQELLAKHAATGAACTVIAARLADPAKYGRMIVDPTTGRLRRIVEWKDASESERAIDLINSGIYAFHAADLWRCLAQLRPDNAQGEYYLTDVISLLVAEGRPVELVITDDHLAVLGVNTPADLAEAGRLLALR